MNKIVIVNEYLRNFFKNILSPLILIFIRVEFQC